MMCDSLVCFPAPHLYLSKRIIDLLYRLCGGEEQEDMMCDSLVCLPAPHLYPFA